MLSIPEAIFFLFFPQKPFLFFFFSSSLPSFLLKQNKTTTTTTTTKPLWAGRRQPTPLISALWRQKQVDLREFEASLVYGTQPGLQRETQSPEAVGEWGETGKKNPNEQTHKRFFETGCVTQADLELAL